MRIIHVFHNFSFLSEIVKTKLGNYDGWTLLILCLLMLNSSNIFAITFMTIHGLFNLKLSI